MKTRRLNIWFTAPLLAMLCMGSAQAVSTFGEAVSAGGAKDASVGLSPSSNEIEYYIPLPSTHSGTYGDGAGVVCAAGFGTCANTGSGSGYGSADSLMMNLFFDLSSSPASSEAILSINFEDLDLKPIHDPSGFNESLKLSYWNVNSNSFAFVGNGVDGVIEHVDGLKSGVFGNPGSLNGFAASTTPDTPVDPFTWHLDLAALGILNNLGGLNDSASTQKGFWIQLGFGSQYRYSDDSPKTGRNTSEFLTAELTVSPVPVPAAFWLFGTALIGFVGISRRTKIS